MQDRTYITRLFQQYLDNRCSPEEVETLLEWLRQDTQADIAHHLLEEQLGRKEDYPADEALKDRLQVRLQHILAKPVRRPVHRIYRWAAAAAVLLVLGLGGYFLLKPGRVVRPMVASAPVIPGSGKAVLVLADGFAVQLDSTGHQSLSQGNTTIQQQGGRLTYNNKGTEQVYNTLYTPRGGQFQVILPDGTKVWLNTASSLKYPTAFIGHERVVEVSGEAYFEVTKDAAKPFRVKMAKGGTVDVLGTSFNIQAYADETKTRTTLLEGSIRVGNIVLQPGRQAVTEGSEIQVKPADVGAVTAWKNGYFIFRDTDINTIMREVARWYDINVINTTDLPYLFNATISRDTPLSELLEILSLTNKVRFITDGRKVTVQP